MADGVTGKEEKLMEEAKGNARKWIVVFGQNMSYQLSCFYFIKINTLVMSWGNLPQICEVITLYFWNIKSTHLILDHDYSCIHECFCLSYFTLQAEGVQGQGEAYSPHQKLLPKGQEIILKSICTVKCGYYYTIGIRW